MIQPCVESDAGWGEMRVQWSRRDVLASGLAAPLAAAFAPPADAARRATGRIGTRQCFEPLRGQAFLLRSNAGSEGRDLRTTLARIDPEQTADNADDGRFVLHFDLVDSGAAAQSIYMVRHPALETFAVLAVPSSADGRSLAVVFNSPR